MTIYPGLSAYSVSLQLAGKAQPGDVNVNMASKSGAGATQSPAYSLELSGNNGKTAAELLRLKRSGQIECQTCQERKYQDGSDDPGVSFKAPGHIAPGSSGSVVMAHEQEHVRNEQANARQEGRRVVAQSVRLFTATCPECGRTYVSGGETRTTTAAVPEQMPENGRLGQALDYMV